MYLNPLSYRTAQRHSNDSNWTFKM